MRLIVLHSQPRFERIDSHSPPGVRLLPSIAAIDVAKLRRDRVCVVSTLQGLRDELQRACTDKVGVVLHVACPSTEDGWLLEADAIDAPPFAVELRDEDLVDELKDVSDELKDVSKSVPVFVVLDAAKASTRADTLAKSLGVGEGGAIWPLAGTPRDFWKRFYSKIIGKSKNAAEKLSISTVKTALETVSDDTDNMPEEPKFYARTSGSVAVVSDKKPERLIQEPTVWVDRPELRDLKKHVEDGKLVVSLVLHSDDGIPGGQGKTTLARKLAFDLRDLFGGHHIELDMKTGLSDMADVMAKQMTVLRACGIPIDEKMSPEDIRLAYRALFSKVRNGVLLFDDVQKDDDKLLVNELLPPKESGWLAIVTTRRGDLMSLKPIAEEHGVGRLSTDAGVELLKKHAYGKNSKRPALVDGDEKVLEEIVEACGHIALAIELAGSRLNKNPSLKLTRLHEQLVAKGAHKLDAMKASLHVSYDDLSDVLKRAFWQAASFPSSFPLVVFENAMNQNEKIDDPKDENNDDESSGFSDDEDEATSSLDTLVSLSLVQRLSDDRFVVHDVVREFARKQAGKEQLTKCTERAGFAYAFLFDEIDDQYRQFDGSNEAIDRMRVEFNALEHFMEFGSFDVRKAIALFGSRSYCFAAVIPQSTLFTFFEKIYNEMLEKNECIRNDEAMVESGFLSVKHRLAQLFEEKGEYEKSMKMFEEVIKVLGPNHPNTLTLKHNLASVLKSMGKYNEAMEMYKQVLAVEERVLVEHHVTLTSKHQLASVLDSMGKYNEAMVMYKEVLAARERVLGVEHPNTLSSKHGLASVLIRMGNYNEAMEMCKEVLAIKERVLGVEHPDTLTSKNNLASVLDSMGKYNEAMVMYKEVLAVQERVLGVEHPNTLSSKDNLANALAEAKQFDEAIHLLERDVIPGRTRVLGPNHPDTINAKKRLSNAKILRTHLLGLPKRNDKKASKRRNRRNR